jgi:hypothetical protein
VLRQLVVVNAFRTAVTATQLPIEITGAFFAVRSGRWPVDQGIH